MVQHLFAELKNELTYQGPVATVVKMARLLKNLKMFQTIFFLHIYPRFFFSKTFF